VEYPFIKITTRQKSASKPVSVRHFVDDPETQGHPAFHASIH